MSALDWIAGSRPLAAAGWTLLHLGWQLAAVAACAALVSRGLGRVPGRSHAVAVAALGAGVVTAVLSFAVLASGPSVAFTSAGADPRVPALLGAPGLPLIARVLPWLGVAWIAFVVLTGARVAGAYVRTARLRYTGVDRGDALAGDYAEAARRLGLRAPPPLVTGHDAGPAVVGWMRPVIVVPRTLFRALPQRDRVAILAHELAHVRRRDPLAKALQTAAVALLGFHPAARWLSRVADREREKACDDLAARAMRDSAHVARALARIALARPAAALPMPALSASASPLVDRIERLARPPATHAGNARAATIATFGAALLVFGLTAGSDAALRDTVELLPIDAWQQRVVFDAQDPAGTFTVAVEGGRAVAVTVDGVAVPGERVRQLGQWISVLDDAPRQPLHIRVVPPGAIEWSARASRAPLPDPS